MPPSLLHLIAESHGWIAALAYGLFTLAALQALLMAVVEKRLHQGILVPLLPWCARLPPLMTLEAMLFRLIHVAFALLTLTVISGNVFSEELFHRALTFNHKTLFALLSWIIFAHLLAGRHFWGWRGRRALHWTLTGFATLLLAYVGTWFVREIILGRI